MGLEAAIHKTLFSFDFTLYIILHSVSWNDDEREAKLQ